MRLCDNCLRRHWKAKINKSTGLQVKHNNGNLIYICIYCGHVQEEEQEYIKTNQGIAANILYIDTEISKSIYYNYKARVPSGYLSTEHLIKEWYMLGWCASYIGSDKVWTGFVTAQQAKTADDSQIVSRLHDLMSAAEILAGHNVNRFDVKKCNTVFLKYGYSPIVDKKTIDTLVLARSKLDLESNKLDYVCKWLGLNGKDEITNDEWIAAQNGNSAALKKIEKYCRGDVVNGKAVLEKLLPLANKKPTFGAIKKDITE